MPRHARRAEYPLRFDSRSSPRSPGTPRAAPWGFVGHSEGILKAEVSVADDVLLPTPTEEQPKLPEELPVLPLRDVVVYPYVILPLSVSREKSIRAVDTALVEHRMILLLSQKQTEMDSTKPEDLDQ